MKAYVLVEDGETRIRGELRLGRRIRAAVKMMVMQDQPLAYVTHSLLPL